MDWAEAQAQVLLPQVVIYQGDDIRKYRAMIAEALWQAFEAGIREGRLREIDAQRGKP